MKPIIDYLLSASAWVRYRTRLDLLHQSESEPAVRTDRLEMLRDPLITGLAAELSGWPVVRLNSHKSAGHPLHKLVFLADLGLTKDDPILQPGIDRVLQHQSDQGPFQVLMNISPHFGGSGQDTWAWALCDAPLLLYALVKFGLGSVMRVQRGIDHLVAQIRENGWPCCVSPELGSFRGPGRKTDPCPYATLVMLKLIAELPDHTDSPAAHTGAESLLSLWEQRLQQHPYLFYMGTDFCKLKAPLVWYDILHVASVLSRFSWLQGDDRFKEMLDIILSKADANGLFAPESIWTAWKEWDFGQKKAPSAGLTLLVQKHLVEMH